MARLNGQVYTCANARYQTDISVGANHGKADTKGSVFPEAIFSGPDSSLWLEHVIEPKTGDKVFWLMWYDADGNPAIRASGVFNRTDLISLANKIIKTL